MALPVDGAAEEAPPAPLVPVIAGEAPDRVSAPWLTAVARASGISERRSRPRLPPR